MLCSENENEYISTIRSNGWGALAVFGTVKIFGSDRRLLNKCSAPADLCDL